MFHVSFNGSNQNEFYLHCSSIIIGREGEKRGVVFFVSVISMAIVKIGITTIQEREKNGDNLEVKVSKRGENNGKLNDVSHQKRGK